MLATRLRIFFQDVIRPRLWKRYQRPEFIRKNGTPKTKIASKWKYKIFTGIGIVTVLVTFFVIFWWLPKGIFYLRYIYRGIPIPSVGGPKGYDILIFFISIPFGFTSGIFLVNSFSRLFSPSLIRRDLLHNMSNAQQSVEPEIAYREAEKRLLKKYNISKIQDRDWAIMLRVWLGLAAVMLGVGLLFLLVL